MPDKKTEEKRRHSTVFQPYSYYECRMPYDFINVPMHWHSEFEVNRILCGEGEFICGSEKFTAGEGALLVLPPNMLHAAYPCQKGELIYEALVFHPSMLGANINDRCTTEYIRPLISGTIKVKPVISKEETNYPCLKACMDRIFHCVSGGCPCPDLLLKSELMRLFWLLESDEGMLCHKDTGINGCETLRPALDYMMKNYRESITVAQLAELSHLSKSYFMNCFKKTVGISAMEYLAQLRIHAVCGDLSSSEKKIADIAFECGYDNISNFNRQFKKVTGWSPKEYRKQGRPKKTGCLMQK